jgi:hypothetical protein
MTRPLPIVEFVPLDAGVGPFTRTERTWADSLGQYAGSGRRLRLHYTPPVQLTFDLNKDSGKSYRVGPATVTYLGRQTSQILMGSYFTVVVLEDWPFPLNSLLPPHAKDGQERAVPTWQVQDGALIEPVPVTPGAVPPFADYVDSYPVADYGHRLWQVDVGENIANLQVKVFAEGRTMEYGIPPVRSVQSTDAKPD